MSNPDVQGRDRRRAYRVPFEDQKCPVIVIDGFQYPITEVSSGGVRILKKEEAPLVPGKRHSAKIRFPGGRVRVVRGLVLRDLGEEIVMQFLSSIPTTDFNRRSFYRVFYPDKIRPDLIVGEKKYPVVDFSELGLCLETGDEPPYEMGDEIRGRVTLRTEDTIEVSGVVQRLFGTKTALLLDYQLPLEIVAKEQRLINRIYGAHSAEDLRKCFDENLGQVAFQYFFASALEGEELIQRLYEIGQELKVEYDIFKLRDEIEALVAEKEFRKDQAVRIAYDVVCWRNQMMNKGND